jgi:GTP cyclohydrolase I
VIDMSDPDSKTDFPRIEAAVKEILAALGEDPNRDGLKDTPGRVARMYDEVFSGLHKDPQEVLTTMFDERHEEVVLVRDIPFDSMCEHHLLPFTGICHIAYIPKGKILGLSKFARLLEVFSKRPQVQERLTSQVATTLMETLNPHGVAVVMKATHSCMTMRGVRKPGSSMVTSSMLGIFRTDMKARSEVLNLIGHD